MNPLTTFITILFVYLLSAPIKLEANWKDYYILETYHDNGQLWRKGTWKTENRTRHGSYEEYYYNGQLNSIGNYKDDEQHGPWESYHRNGQLKDKRTYKDGKPDGLWESYHDNGQLKYKGNYRYGEKDGLWNWYYQSGNLEKTETYNASWNLTLNLDDLVKRNGLYYKKFTSDPFTGEISGEVNGDFKDGKPEGIWEFNDANGNLLKREIYKNGVKTLTEYFVENE